MKELNFQKNKNKLEKERIRFLGKNLAGRLKERKESNDKNQFENSKSGFFNINKKYRSSSADNYSKKTHSDFFN